MTEPTTPLPESPHCRVRARVASIWADGPDAGTSPDWRPAVGEKVTLTPSISSQLLVYDAAGASPIIVTVERVQCEVDADGWLVKADGRPVYIAPTDDPLMSATGWTWTATIKGKSIAFSAPAGGVVDLALFVATPAVDATEYVSVVQIVADYITANPPDVEQAVADWLTANPPAAAPDATTAAKGLIRLAGDLGGTADAPTVPGLADKADTDHTHAISDVTGLQTALDGKQAAGSYAPATHNHDGTYAPANHNHDSAYAAATHSHAYADLTGTPTIPDSPDDIGAAPASHGHTAADIDSGAAIDGHILTADGAGGAAWEAPPAGGGGGGTDPWTYYAVTGDVGNNTATYATITGLSVPAGLAAGQYEVKVMLTGTSASGGFTVGVDRPNNSRSDGYQQITISGANISRKWIAGGGPGINADSEHASTHAASYQAPLYEASFILTVTATTTSALSIAHKAATAGSNIVIKAGSYLAIRRISA